MTAESQTQTTSDEDYLKDICKKTIDWENAADDQAVEEFDRLLDVDLCFRRANGKTVGKTKFLVDLRASGELRPEEKSRRQLYRDDVDCRVYEEQAVATLIVKTTPWNNPHDEGLYYRNIRVFRRGEVNWQLQMWFNVGIPAPGSGLKDDEPQS